MDKISIIIPIYNVEKYVSECMTSILNQTYKNIEIIAIIDGSTDNSENIVRQMANSDSRITVISRGNKGAFATRKEGINLATGKYFMFVDADDWLEYNTIEQMYNLALKYNADIVKCGYIHEFVDQGRQVVCNGYSKEAETFIKKDKYVDSIYKTALSNNSINSIWGQIIKKKDYDFSNIDERTTYGEDLLQNLEIINRSDNILYISNPYYHYRVNGYGITGNLKLKNCIKCATDSLYVYSKYFDRLKDWGIDSTENRKQVAYKVLSEFSKSLLRVFYAKDFDIKTVKDFLNIVLSGYTMNHIRENLSLKEINNLNIKNKLLIKSIYLNDVKNIIRTCTIYYRSIFKIKSIIKILYIKLKNIK